MTTTRQSIAAAAIAATVMISGCSVDSDEEAPPPPLRESVMGTNAEIGDILLRSVHIEAPQLIKYQQGEEAKLWLTLLNDGRQPDTLTSVSSTVAADAHIFWDSDCNGQAQVAAQLPLRPAGPVPVEPSAGVPPFDAYYVQLQDLNREVLAGTSVPVAFTFDRAGAITVEALVQPSNAPRPEPSLRCAASSAPNAPTSSPAPSKGE